MIQQLTLCAIVASLLCAGSAYANQTGGTPAGPGSGGGGGGGGGGSGDVTAASPFTVDNLIVVTNFSADPKGIKQVTGVSISTGALSGLTSLSLGDAGSLSLRDTAGGETITLMTAATTTASKTYHWPPEGGVPDNYVLTLTNASGGIMEWKALTDVGGGNVVSIGATNQDNRITRWHFSGVGPAAQIQTSPVTVADDGSLSGIVDINATGNVFGNAVASQTDLYTGFNTTSGGSVFFIASGGTSRTLRIRTTNLNSSFVWTLPHGPCATDDLLGFASSGQMQCVTLAAQPLVSSTAPWSADRQILVADGTDRLAVSTPVTIDVDGNLATVNNLTLNSTLRFYDPSLDNFIEFVLPETGSDVSYRWPTAPAGTSEFLRTSAGDPTQLEWVASGGGGGGSVTGPVSSTATSVAIFADTSGSLLASSPIQFDGTAIKGMETIEQNPTVGAVTRYYGFDGSGQSPVITITSTLGAAQLALNANPVTINGGIPLTVDGFQEARVLSVRVLGAPAGENAASVAYFQLTDYPTATAGITVQGLSDEVTRGQFAVYLRNSLQGDQITAMFAAADGTITFGSPSSPVSGAGFVNGVAFYDDGTLLTDWVFECAQNGRSADGHACTTMSFSDTEEFVKNNKHLPTIVGREQWERQHSSLGQLATQLWETSETQFLYLSEMQARLNKLELQMALLRTSCGANP